MYITPSKQAQLSQREVNEIVTLQSQKRLTSYPYYSRVRFRAAQAGEGPFTYTVAQGAQVRAFSYAVGEQKTSAGFVAAEGDATIADTNLTNRSQTTSGQAVLIRGIAIQAEPAALTRDDPSNPFDVRKQSAQFLAALWESVSVEMSLNGDENRFRLGALGNIPGGSGLQGGAADPTGLFGGTTAPQPRQFATNGWPTRANYFQLPEGLLWKPQGNPDANLNIIFQVSRAITINSGGPDNASDDQASGAAGDPAKPEIVGYNFPALLAQDLRVLLIGEVVAKRTNSA
jgi:hypothetical protein